MFVGVFHRYVNGLWPCGFFPHGLFLKLYENNFCNNKKCITFGLQTKNKIPMQVPFTKSFNGSTFMRFDAYIFNLNRDGFTFHLLKADRPVTFRNLSADQSTYLFTYTDGATEIIQGFLANGVTPNEYESQKEYLYMKPKAVEAGQLYNHVLVKFTGSYITEVTNRVAEASTLNCEIVQIDETVCIVNVPSSSTPCGFDKTVAELKTELKEKQLGINEYMQTASEVYNALEAEKEKYKTVCYELLAQYNIAGTPEALEKIIQTIYNVKLKDIQDGKI